MLVKNCTPRMLECPSVHPDSGAPYSPWRSPALLPEAIKARLRPLVRGKVFDLADCAHIAHAHLLDADWCECAIRQAETQLRRPTDRAQPERTVHA
ncbi:hypothetical protein GCM10009097_05040 [Pigmentiphaga daeguensis]|uniref:Uncharacterized protein n=1 Tax=Pigmentiphaga daeguensis TaxID=414049 RepID=A0ABP3L327_9BURK